MLVSGDRIIMGVRGYELVEHRLVELKAGKDRSGQLFQVIFLSNQYQRPRMVK